MSTDTHSIQHQRGRKSFLQRVLGRSPRTTAARHRFRPRFEALETRTLLAADPTAVFTSDTGILEIKGTSDDDVFKVRADAAGDVEVLYNGAPLAVDLPGGAENGATVNNVIAIVVTLKAGNDKFTLCRDERMNFTVDTKGGLGADTFELLGTENDEILQLQSTQQGRSNGYVWSLTDKPSLGQVPSLMIGEATSVESFVADTEGGRDHGILVLGTILRAAGDADVVLYLGEGSDTADVQLGNPDNPPSITETFLPNIMVDGQGGEDLIGVVTTGDVDSVAILNGGGQSDVIAIDIDTRFQPTLDGGDAQSLDMLVVGAPQGGTQLTETNFELVFELSSDQPVVCFDATGQVAELHGDAGTMTRVNSSTPVVFLVSGFDMRLERSGETWLTDFAVFLEDPSGELSSMSMPLVDALIFLRTEDPMIIGPPL